MTNSTKKILKKIALDVYAACIGVCILIVTIHWMGQLTPEFLESLIQFISDFDPLASLKGGNAIDPTNFIN